MQYAAHVPNGDFVIFLRKLLSLPNANEYFPKLTLHDGHIHYMNENNTLTQLENDASTQPLMKYFNPTLADVENQELICSARMVHWAINDPAHRKLQVETAITHFKKNMSACHQRFGLDNAPAKICQMICDIRHQGRGKNDRIANAIATDGDYEKFNDKTAIHGSYKSLRIGSWPPRRYMFWRSYQALPRTTNRSAAGRSWPHLQNLRNRAACS